MNDVSLASLFQTFMQLIVMLAIDCNTCIIYLLFFDGSDFCLKLEQFLFNHGLTLILAADFVLSLCGQPRLLY